MEVGVMPKQQVVGEAGEPVEVTVGWSADSLQIGVETSDGRSLVTLLYGGYESRIQIARQVYAKLGVRPPDAQTSDQEAEQLAQVGRELLDIIEANGDGRLSYTGVFATFGRSSVNSLIKLLRRARDVAFGKDE